MSYFDNLPDDVIEQVLRYTSHKPRSKYWKSAIRLSDVAALLSMSENVLEHINHQFDDIVFINRSTTMDDQNSLIFHSADDLNFAYPVLLHLSRSASKLNVQKSFMVPYSNHCAALIHYITNNCTNLKSLTFQDFICDSDADWVLSTRGSKLEELSLSFSGPVATQEEPYWHLVLRSACSVGVQAMPRVDVIEETLTSISKYCENLRRLELKDLTNSNDSFWISVGRTIKELVLRFSPMFDIIQTVSFIEQHCRHLESVEVLNSTTGFSLSESSAITTMLASYGENLKRASLLDIDPSCCFLVAAKCPNVQVVVGHMFRVDEQISVVGSLTTEIRFDHLWTNADIEREVRLRESFEKCTQVRKITGRVLGSYCLWSLDLFAAVFGRPMRMLEVFEWPKWLIDKEELAEATHALAANSRSLRKLKMTCENWELGMFEELVDSNRNLQFVTIGLNSETFYEAPVILDILKTFSKGRELRHLVVDLEENEGRGRHVGTDFEAIKSFCWSLRNRNLFVQIGSVDYLA